MREIDGRSFRRYLPAAFPRTLRELRESRGISQLRLAKLVEVDHSYVSRLEHGLRAPSVALLHRIADALALSPEERQQLFASAGFPVLPQPQSLIDALDQLQLLVHQILAVISDMRDLLSVHQGEDSHAESHHQGINHNG